MKLKKIHLIGLIFGTLILIVDIVFFTNKEDKDLFLFLIGIAFSIIVLPFIMDIIMENKKEDEMSAMFLEFSRNLAESVGAGTPISKSIINMKSNEYGQLGPHVKKLANQISIGIPVSKAMQTFAFEIGNPVISRSVTLISEAEKAGGEIDYILESSAKSISEVEKLKKERKSAIYALVMQGYIIFFIFIGIMLVMEFKILPLVTDVGFDVDADLNSALDFSKTSETSSTKLDPEKLASPFLYLLLIEGFFSGLIIGKLTEGSLKNGIRHSFFLTITAFLVSSGIRLAISG
ncbi:MAG: type II secretion system F family protein [Nanoarchaeota archaeon]